MQNQSIPFIYYNRETSYFELSERALDLIINNKKRMGIVSIFGEKNTGKSFIMNHILGDDQAFPVKSVGENSVFTSFN